MTSAEIDRMVALNDGKPEGFTPEMYPATLALDPMSWLPPLVEGDPSACIGRVLTVDSCVRYRVTGWDAGEKVLRFAKEMA